MLWLVISYGANEQPILHGRHFDVFVKHLYNYDLLSNENVILYSYSIV